MANPGWQSALGGRVLDDAAVHIGEGDARAMVDLRMAAGNDEAMATVAKSLGFALPTTPRTSSRKDDVTALWLSIDQWLLVAPFETRGALRDNLSKALDKHNVAITDMSDARTVIRLEGDGCREIIMKGAAADLISDDFKPGTVRRLNFAGIAGMVHLLGQSPDKIDLYVFRSYADYAIRWLEVAARPGANLKLFGATPPPPS